MMNPSPKSENVIDGLNEVDKVCYVCNTHESPDKLMICDSCDFKICHTYCLENPIKWIPEENFYCSDCCSVLLG